jgi:hypothetical protein
MTLAEQLQYLKFSVRKNDPKSQQRSLDAMQWGLNSTLGERSKDFLPDRQRTS